MQQAGIQQEMEQARLDFHELLKRASAEDPEAPDHRHAVDQPATAVSHGVRLPSCPQPDAAGSHSRPARPRLRPLHRTSGGWSAGR